MLAHVRQGGGPRQVLLLHGFLGSGRNLTTLAKRLVERDPSLTLVIPDLRGHGTSPPLPPGADLAALARDVLELGVTRPFAIIGHSLGGRVGLKVRLLEPGAVARVTLLDITPAPIVGRAGVSGQALAVLLAAPAEAPSRDVVRAHLRAGGLEDAIVEWLLLNLTHEAGVYRWRIDRAALAELHERVNAEDLWAAVGEHVRCIRGGRSRYVSDADASRLQAAGATVTTIPDAGHFVHVDQLAELVDAVVEGTIAA